MPAFIQRCGFMMAKSERHRSQSQVVSRISAHYAGVDEGMNGLSTRFAFEILSRVFKFIM
ncbi:hypothetical protein ACLB1E_20335 [Escherichia coli]